MACSVIIIGYGGTRPAGPLDQSALPPQVHLMVGCPACRGGGYFAFDDASTRWIETFSYTQPAAPTSEIYVLLFVEMGGQTGIQRATEWIEVTERTWLKDARKRVHTIDHTVS
jgi:hypothetical protein